MTRSIVLAAALCFVPVAALAAAPVADVGAVLGDEAVAEGTVKSVDAKASSFVLTTGGKDITVKYDAKTKFLRGGKDAKMEDVLKAGAKVKVHHKDAMASKVDAVEEKA